MKCLRFVLNVDVSVFGWEHTQKSNNIIFEFEWQNISRYSNANFQPFDKIENLIWGRNLKKISKNNLPKTFLYDFFLHEKCTLCTKVCNPPPFMNCSSVIRFLVQETKDKYN